MSCVRPIAPAPAAGVRVEVRLLADQPASSAGSTPLRAAAASISAANGRRARRSRRSSRAWPSARSRSSRPAAARRRRWAAPADDGVARPRRAPARPSWPAICSIRSRRTAALTRLLPAAVDRRGPSRRAWRRRAGRRPAWCSARWRSLRRSRTSRRRWRAARAWRRASTSASRRVTSSSALRRSRLDALEPELLGDDRLPVERGAGAAARPAPGGPGRSAARSAAASRSRRVRLAASSSRARSSSCSRSSRTRSSPKRNGVVIHVPGSRTQRPRPERRLDARPTWHPRAACGIAARSSSSPRSSSS